MKLSHRHVKKGKRPQKLRNRPSDSKMSRFNTNPVISAKIKSSGQLAPSDGDSEDVTSNDTVPVSNETEAELTVNETGPSYIDLKDSFSANMTQEIKEIPKIIEDGSLNSASNDTFVGKKYSSAVKESKEPILIGKDYSNEMKEKERPEVIHFEGKTQKNRVHADNSKDFSYSSRLAATEDSVKPRLRSNVPNKPGTNHALVQKTIDSPSLFNRGTEFNPFSKIESAKNTSTKLGSTLQYNSTSDLTFKRVTPVNVKLKSGSDAHFAKLIKRMERTLRKSRISSHNDLLRLRKLVYNLGHLTQNKQSLSTEINDLMQNASAGIGERLSGIEKRMQIAGGNAVLNNITTVLVQLFEKIKNSDSEVNSTTKHTENANNAPKESHGHGRNQLKLGDMAQRIRHFEKVFQKHLKNEKLAKCKEASSVLNQMSLSGGFGNVRYFSNSTVKDMDHCIEMCCSNKRCDLAILENSECYGVDCKHQNCLLSPVVKPSVESNVALLTKRISANIGFTGTPTSSSTLNKCEVQPHVIKNSVLGQGGLKGNATVLEHVTDAWPCGMECCKVNSCNVAMIQEGVCYIVSCLSDGPCFEFEHSAGQKTSLVFVQRSKSKPPILQPSLSVSTLKLKGTPSATPAHVSKSTYQSVLFSSIQSSRSTSSQLHSSPATIKEAANTGNYSYYQKTPAQPLINPNHTDFDLNVPLHHSESSYSHEIQSFANTTNHPNTCVRTFPLSNVTLRAGFSAGNYKFQGKVYNTSICVDHCCRSEDCNVAFVLQKMCFLVTCSSNKLCQNEPLLSNQFQSSMFYVARSSLETDMVKKELVPTLKRKISNSSKKSKIHETSEKIRPKTNFTQTLTTQHGCSIGFVASNAKFLHGFESGEIIIIGKLKFGISDCISKCCSYNGCNASLTVSGQCFLVKCYSKESCQIVESDSNVETSVATVIRRPDERSFSYLLAKQLAKEVSSFTSTSSKEVKPTISKESTHSQNSMKRPDQSLSNAQKFDYHSSNSSIAPSSVYNQEAISSKPFPIHHITANNVQVSSRTPPVSIIQPSVANKVNGPDLSEGSTGHDQNKVMKESVPENNDSVANTEMLKKIQASLNHLVQANRKSNNAVIVNNEIPHASKSEFVSHGIADHHMINLSKNAAHLENSNASISMHNKESKVSHEKSESTNEISKVENNEKNEVLGKIYTKNRHEIADSNKSTFADLVSKIRNVSREQAQLIKNIPKFNQIIGKIQQHLENESRLADSERSQLERKNFIVQNNDADSSSIQRLPKASVQSSLSQEKKIFSKNTRVIPTPKLVQSPAALVTSPSFIGVQEVQSTTYRTSSTSPKLSVSASSKSKYRNEKPDIGKQIVKALQNAGVIPVKPVQINSLTNLLNTEASVVKKTSRTTKKPSTKLARSSSIVPVAQRLLNFLEEQMRLRTTNSKNAERLESIARSREESKYSKRINGLMDEKHILNQRIKNLESVIHHLKSRTSSFHPNKNKIKSSLSVKHSQAFHVASSGRENEAHNAEDDRRYLLQQLKSIVRSELAHNNQIVSPTSTSTQSMNTKRMYDSRNAMKHEIILEHNLNRLYNHAVVEMKNALESSGRSENEGNWRDSENFVHENVRKNYINSKQDKRLPNNIKKVSSPVSKSPTFLEIALKRPKNMTNRTNALFGIFGWKKDDRKTGKTKISSEHIGEQPEASISQHYLNSSPKDPIVQKGSNLYRHKVPVFISFEANIPSIHGQNQSFSSKRTGVVNDKAATCHHSAVQHHVTLRGGIAKEGVEDAGIVVGINECIARCCRSTSCSVAFMLENNCFLLPCTESQICQSVELPTKSLHTRLAFVRRSSNANHELKIFDDVVKALELSSSSKVQKSSEDPQVKTSEFPSQINSVKADVTGQVEKNRKNEKLFSSSGSSHSNNPTMQVLLDEMDKLTSQTGSEDNNIAKKTDSNKNLLGSHDTKTSTYVKSNQDHTTSQKLALRAKLCPYGEVEYNTTIQGGLAAAKYKYGGKVSNINECVEMCCESASCNIAFMFSNECFLLMCKSKNQCKSIPAASTKLSLRMVRLLRTESGENIQKLKEPAEVLKEVLNPKKSIIATTTKTSQDAKHKNDSVSACMKSDPLLHVVPKHGMRLGNFKDFGRVKSVEECVEFCCGWKKCRMAFMVLDGCFGVSCQNSCGIVRSKDLSFQSKVVYVKRRQDVLDWLTSQGTTRSTVPGAMRHEGIRGVSVSGRTGEDQSVYPNNKTKNFTKSVSTESPTVENGLAVKKTSNIPLNVEKPQTTKLSKLRTDISGKNFISKPLALPGNVTVGSIISKNKRGDGIKPKINVKAAVEPKFMNRNDDRRLCIPGEVEHDVTLGGGINAGSYTEQGEILNMHECVEWCCKDRKCDVAMVIKGICYTVSCYDLRKCVSVPVRRIQYHPKLVRVKRVKRGTGNDGFYDTRNNEDVSLQKIVEGSSRTPGIVRSSFDDQYENEKSAIEDELVDLLAKQSSREFDKPLAQKGEKVIILDAFLQTRANILHTSTCGVVVTIIDFQPARPGFKP